MQEYLNEKAPPFSVSVGIWWSLMWRAFVWWSAFSMVCLVCYVALVYFLSNGLGMQREWSINLSIAIFFPPIGGALIIAPLAVVKKLFGKKFSGYRLLLVKEDQAP